MSSRATSAERQSAARTLLDDIIPAFDFGNHHAMRIAVPAARVAAAIEAYRVERDSSILVRLLFRLRGLGQVRGPIRAALSAEGFRVLAERPGEELVLGIGGRFWALRETAHLMTIKDARAFATFHEPGCAKAAMNLRVQALTKGVTRLSTETRVKCVDAAAYWRFAPYWALIKLFSGWIRWDLLRAIRRLALTGGADHSAGGKPGGRRIAKPAI